jgi:hypothetical protein
VATVVETVAIVDEDVVVDEAEEAATVTLARRNGSQ